MKVYGEIPYEVIIDAVKKGCDRQESADSISKTLKRKLNNDEREERREDNKAYGKSAVKAYKAQRRIKMQEAGSSLRAAGTLGKESDSDSNDLDSSSGGTSDSSSESESESEEEFEDSGEESDDLNKPADAPEDAGGNSDDSVQSPDEFEDSSEDLEEDNVRHGQESGSSESASLESEEAV